MNISERSAFLRGLAEGLELDCTKPEGKLISAMLELISDLTAELSDCRDKIKTLGDYADELDHDLGELEEFVYGGDGDCDCDDGDCDCCECDGCDECELDPDEFEDDMMQTECPACGEEIHFDLTVDPKKLVCPSCGVKVFEELDK